VAVAVLLPARPAAAHAVLAGSDPANGASLSRVPAVVVLRFSEDLSATASTARLMDAAGTPVAGARIVANPDRRRELSVRIPPLAAGSYAVVWQVSGGSDGHPTSGILVFTVEPGATRATGGPADQHGGGTLESVLRWLRLVLLAGLVAGLALAGLILAPAAAGDPARLLVGMAQPIRRRVLAIAAVCSGAAACVALAGLGWGPPDARRLGQVAAFALAVPVLLALRRALAWPLPGRYPLRGGWLLAAGLTAGACLLEAAVGGTATRPDGRALAVAAAGVHVFTGCLVVGLVGILAALLWRPGPAGVQRAAVVRSCRRPLVRLTVVGAALATATGLYGAGYDVGSVDQLPHTAGGWLLLVRAALVLVGCWLLLAGAARLYRWGRPTAALRRLPSRPLLAASLACGLALLATGVAADAVGTAQPARAAAASPMIRDGRLDDLVVSVSVVPNRPGPNGFTVTVASSRRPAPAPVEQVALTYPDGGGSVAVALAAVGSGRFFGTATLGQAGIASLVVVVRRSGAQLSVPIPWSVPVGAAPPRTDGVARLLRVPISLLLSFVIGLGVWWLLPSPRRWRVDI
jgi:copper transport protein